MSHPWMPLYVADYLADTGHLSTAEHGAYLLLIMHYWQNGALPDDERKLARICRLAPEEWALARETLAGLFGEGWSHKRIDVELVRTEERYRKRVEAGRKGGLARANAQPRSSIALAEPEQCPTNHNHSHKEEDSPVPPPEARPPRRVERGAFLDEGWRPSPANSEWAAAELGGAEQAARTFERFRNYWLAKAGRDGRKRDWDLTWRNWVNEEVDRANRNAQRSAYRGPQHQHASSQHQSSHDALIAAVAERVLGGDDGPSAADPGGAGADVRAAASHRLLPRRAG
jgi:uncharacterized protein YdaU (DUF1376 family)